MQRRYFACWLHDRSRLRVSLGHIQHRRMVSIVQRWLVTGGLHFCSSLRVPCGHLCVSLGHLHQRRRMCIVQRRLIASELHDRSRVRVSRGILQQRRRVSIVQRRQHVTCWINF